MARYIVNVELPLEIDYTITKKNAKCRVTFNDNTILGIECTIDNVKFTPKSINDDLMIISKARDLYKQGKFVTATDEKKQEVKHYTDTLVKKIVLVDMVKPKPDPVLKPKKDRSYFEIVKEFVTKNNGKVTVNDVAEALNITRSAVQNSLVKLNVTKVRDMNYKWKGRRFFLVINQAAKIYNN